MALSLSWEENKNRKYVEASSNHQTVQVSLHLTKACSDFPGAATNIKVPKSKIEVKKEGFKRKSLTSYLSEEKGKLKD